MPDDLTPSRARQLIREKCIIEPTSGMCSGFVQANLTIVPASAADDFERLCQQNGQALPLIERLPDGQYSPTVCDADSDVRTDTGAYSIYDGEKWLHRSDVLAEWADDSVAFLIGCSFSAERSLKDAGVELRHLELGGNVPIYRTNRELSPAGTMKGHLVVSMRAIRDDQVKSAVKATAALPMAHGAPVWIGDGNKIGCANGHNPDWGMELPLLDGETPVYWACGVTPRTVIEESGILGAIVHAPGHMFITDIPDHVVSSVTPEEWSAKNAAGRK